MNVFEPVRCRKRTAARHLRRGSALILVMTILGVLFVSGVALVATMNFEARLAAVAAQSGQEQIGGEVIENAIGSVLRDGLVPLPNLKASSNSVGQYAPERIIASTGETVPRTYEPSRSTFVELPGVHGILSSSEPYQQTIGGAATGEFLYPAVSDPKLMIEGPPEGSLFSNHPDYGPINEVVTTRTHDDPDAPLPQLDADGDGIVDSISRDLSLLGVSASQMAQLAKIVNPPDNADGKVNVGLRIIPHGAMVNLSASHPLMIEKALDLPSPDWYYQLPSRLRGPYSPLLEEASLRHRGFLPQRLPPVTALQGDPNNTSDPDFPGDGAFPYLFPRDETVLRDQHRYWPYRPEVNDDYEQWGRRMDPSWPVLYDRRHLATSVSYDSLLSRGAFLEVASGAAQWSTRSVRDQMMAINEEYTDPDNCALRFEYVDYPHDMKNRHRIPNRDCVCPTDRDCQLNPRKGRMRMSLPWLDTAFDAGFINRDFRDRLIQETFTMLLLNARGEEWGASIEDVTSEIAMQLDEADRPAPRPARIWSEAGKLNISRAAASLAANLIDFADGGSVPTRVQLRTVDFANGTAGEPMGTFAYGIEIQPYLTEVSARIVYMGGSDSKFEPNPQNSAYAVELFNPYKRAIPDADDPDERYSLRVNATGPNIALNNPIDRSSYLVVASNETRFEPMIANDIVQAAPELAFTNGDIIYLIRHVTYPTEPTQADIVVDQFHVNGDNIALSSVSDLTLDQRTFSMERPGVAAQEVPQRDSTGFRPGPLRKSPWFAPIPAGDDAEFEGHTLGRDSDTDAPNDLRPVEVLLADNGANFVNQIDPTLSRISDAYPTTGCLLLLMRFANRDIVEAVQPPGDSDLAFTTRLDDVVTVDDADVSLKTQIDNGRMPIFDVGRVHHDNPAFTDLGVPGDLSSLPWGQLVFDYFTALPLNNQGPYTDPVGGTYREDARPRVDLDGLRVHGRVNLNAAPWKALSGVPFIPVDNLPLEFQDSVANAVPGLRGRNYLQAHPIGDDLAQAIVAYREMRSVGGSEDYYALRGWDAGDLSKGLPNPPVFRRGTGFLSVGELANVRHDVATGNSRFDNGIIGSPQESEGYIAAVATLVALSDWVTVRSDVFTVYGILRGEPKEPIDPDPDPVGTRNRTLELDARALRFQETLDRIPTFLGQPSPSRIGDRTITRYIDTRN